MKKQYLIAGLVILGVVGGGTAYMLTKKDTAKNNETSAVQNNNQAASAQEVPTALDALSTKDTSFSATITSYGEDGSSKGVAKMEYDKTNGNVRYTAAAESGSMTIIYTQDAYYMCQTADSCIKYVNNGIGATSFDASAYEYDSTELDAIKTSSTFAGKKDCPAGTCYAWTVNNTTSGSAGTIYIDTKTKRISQVESTANVGKSTIVYEYKDVSIPIPANAREITVPQVSQ